ncbi:hypothetical protein VQL36_06400 [Chengkuizengella sp. SCS-71B]|uniref:hypothetical protein n=1 Tax=Chengkuizengella sp. SCS-71B TaxID=3115290 RepID=UPI0032C244BA
MQTNSVETISTAYQQAVLRWKQGHQSFQIIIITMNTLLDSSIQALNQREWNLLTKSLDRLSNLMKASTATMKYTSDFSPKSYEELIRPSMMPPFLNDGFSGVLNIDHKLMLNKFRKLRDLMVQKLGDKHQWPSLITKSWNQFMDTQAHNREHHGLVCQHFVDDGVSLMQNFYKEKRKTNK